jgi:hypothetical protein
MKRVWLGVVLALFASVSSLFANVPTAAALPSGQCIGNTGCVIFKVNLNAGGKPGPTTAATVHVHRTASTGRPQDDDFDLVPDGNNNSYTSQVMVWGTGPSDPSCNNVGTTTPATNPANLFTVTISGSATGNGGPINLCANENPKAVGGVKTLTVPVQVKGQTATLGGISGTLNAVDAAGNNRPCPNTTVVTFTGPTSGKTVTVTGTAGAYNSGLVLAPGTYEVSANCVINGQAGIIKISGVVVTAGKTTVANGTCNSKTTQCGNNGDPNVTPSPAADDTPPPDCDAGGLTFLVCAPLKLALGAIDFINESIIVPFLDEPALTKDSEAGKPLYGIWTAFRNVASVFFILIFFLMIFGTAIGFDNYTIKKVMPRLIAGAILVPFSWYVCVFFVDLGNILGHGLLALTGSVIPESAINFRSNLSKIFFGGAAIVLVGGVIGAIATISLGVVFSILISLLGVFLTLVFRKILISILIVLSPLAFLAWILPNTQKWYKLWWTNLFRLIMMYPLVMLLFEAGRLFSYTSGSLTGQANSSVKPFFQIVGLFAPTFLIPWTFKWTGGLLSLGTNQIGKLTNAMDKRVGKDSNFAKDRAAERERKNLIREKDTLTAASAAAASGQKARAAMLSRKASMYRRRSGLGTGLTGGAVGGVQAQMRREEALSKARTFTAKYNANKQTNEIPHSESATQRIEAEQRQILDQTAADRGARKGVLQSMSEMGNNSRQRTVEAYEAGRIGSNRNYASKAGQDQAEIDAERAHRQTADEVAASSRTLGAEKGAEERGKVSGTNQTATEVDGKAAGDAAVAEAQRHAALSGRTLSPTEIDRIRSRATTNQGALGAARNARLEGAGADAARAAKDHFTDDHGGIVGRNAIESGYESAAVNVALAAARRAKGSALTPEETQQHRQAALAALSQQRTNTNVSAAMLNARNQHASAEELRKQGVNLENQEHEEVGQVIRNASLEARNRIAADKKARIERLNANDPSKGGVRLTDRDVLDAAAYNARGKAIDEVSGTISSINNSINSGRRGETIGSRIGAAVESGDIRGANEIGDRLGLGTSRVADRQKVANELVEEHMANGMTRAQAVAALTNEDISTRRANERIAIAAEHAEDKYLNDSGSRKQTLDAHHDAEQALALEQGRPAAEGASLLRQATMKAAGVNAKKSMDKKLGDIMGDADSANLQNDSGTNRESARIAKLSGQATDAGTTRGVITQQARLERRAIKQARSQGVRIGYPEARKITVSTRGAAAQKQAEKRGATDYADAEGTVAGYRKAERVAFDKARASGRSSFSRHDAADEIMDTATDAASIITDRRLLETYGQERGVIVNNNANRVQDSKRIAAAQYVSQKQAGSASGEVEGQIKASEAEARRDGVLVGSEGAAIGSARRSAKSSQADTTKRFSEAFGNEQSNIDVGLTPEGQLTADEMAEQAENAGVNDKMTAANTLRGDLEEQRKQIGQVAGTKYGKLSPQDAFNKARIDISRNFAEPARDKARIDTGKKYKNAEGANAGIARSIKKAQDHALEQTGKVISPADAKEVMYSTIADTGVREGYNKAMSSFSEARGIQEKRASQHYGIMEEIAKERGQDINSLNTADMKALGAAADERMDDAADTSIADDAGNRLLQSTGQELGYLRTKTAAVDRGAKEVMDAEIKRVKAATPGISDAAAEAQARARISPIAARNMARQNIDTAKLRRNAGETALNKGQEIGQDDAIVDTADRAADLLADNTLAAPLDVVGEVTLADGTRIGEAGTITTLPAGTTLNVKQMNAIKEARANAGLSPVSTIDKAAARTTIVNSSIKSGRELGVRAQAAKQGSISAFSQIADAQGTATTEERISSYTQDELDRATTENGKIQAQAKIIGTPMQRSVGRAIEESADNAHDRLIESKASEANDRNVFLYEVDSNGKLKIDPATKRPVESTVPSRIGNIPHDGPGNATLSQIVRDSKASGDEATMRAALRRLAGADSGRDQLVKLRDELFGGSVEDNYGVENFSVKAETGVNLAQWERAMQSVKAPGSPDIVKPDGNAFKDMTGKTLTDMDSAAVKRYVDYLDRLRESSYRAQAAAERERAAGKKTEANELENRAKDLWKQRNDRLKQMAISYRDIGDNENLRSAFKDQSRKQVESMLNSHAEWGPVSQRKDVAERYDKIDRTHGIAIPTAPSPIAGVNAEVTLSRPSWATDPDMTAPPIP